MIKLFRNFLIFFLMIGFVIYSKSQVCIAMDTSFKDVPKEHWASEVINQLRDLHITEGIGNNYFGLGKTISRAEFVAFLVRVCDWELEKPKLGSFTDNQNINVWYFSYVETALVKGALAKDSLYFRPDDPITREEMAILIVRSMGYDYLALQFNNVTSPFSDVVRNVGYTKLLKDYGIITGTGNNLYNPLSTATREEAAAILIRMYNKLNNPIKNLHGFYSYMGYLQENTLSTYSSISFDWLTLNYDAKTNKVILKSPKPSSFLETVNIAKSNATTIQLMLYADNSKKIILEDGKSLPFVTYILSNKIVREKLIEDIILQVSEETPFDGITIDFESLRGDENARLFNNFLIELNQFLKLNNKNLYVVVHPTTYFDGYDYTTIGDIADQVILMAHDYEAKKLSIADMENGLPYTPLTPIKSVYNDLKAITDSEKGVRDLNKVWLQISFSAAQWQSINGKVINQTSYVPTYEMIHNRLIQDDVSIHYDLASQNPFAMFYNKDTDVENKIWYEDSRSVYEKIKLAKMFGISGISLWSIGNIPDYSNNSPNNYLNIWQILSETINQ